MKSENSAQIQKAFTQQAAGFESRSMNFSKQDYLDYAVARVAPEASDALLEVAAGTCACGRAFAPRVRSVVCLDMTAAMLKKGKAAAEQERLQNMTFMLGDAADLPFADGSFDIVFSRLAFHHFPEPETPFSEMARVLKPDGKLVMIDMAAAEEPLRKTEDALEILRDPSHVRNLSQQEMLALYERHGLNIDCCETVCMPVRLDSWMAHTATLPETQALIRAQMEAELTGGAPTGFYPYRRNSAIMFDQRWTLIIGRKPTADQA